MSMIGGDFGGNALTSGSRFLFEVEGVPHRSLFRKLRSHVAFFEDCIVIELDGTKSVCTKAVINDIYVQEPVIETVPSRTVAINLIEQGVNIRYELEETTFPGLANLVELALAREWSHIRTQYQYPPTVHWFLAASAVIVITCGLNWRVFGLPDQWDEVREWRETLNESWGITTEVQLAQQIERLLKGSSVTGWQRHEKYNGTLDSFKETMQIHQQKDLWAWDLQRVFWLTIMGVDSRYHSRETAYDWCLHAAHRLQQIFTSWDEFQFHYVRGYAHWSGSNLDDPTSEAARRMGIFHHYTHLPSHPWQVPWDLELKKQW